jgi:hypothetical protein
MVSLVAVMYCDRIQDVVFAAFRPIARIMYIIMHTHDSRISVQVHCVYRAQCNRLHTRQPYPLHQ